MIELANLEDLAIFSAEYGFEKELKLRFQCTSFFRGFIVRYGIY